MSHDSSPGMEALGRAGRRVAYHLLQAVVEGLKAVEAVIEEIGHINDPRETGETTNVTKIEIE